LFKLSLLESGGRDPWIYNNLCNQCTSQMLWVQIPLMLRCTQQHIMW